jgi:hypothetical protein
MLGTKKKSATKRMPIMVELPQQEAAPANKPVEITYEMISQRAYEISQTKGNNDPVRDWLEAEAELRAATK